MAGLMPVPREVRVQMQAPAVWVACQRAAAARQTPAVSAAQWLREAPAARKWVGRVARKWVGPVARKWVGPVARKWVGPVAPGPEAHRAQVVLAAPRCQTQTIVLPGFVLAKICSKWPPRKART
ncbi:MAG: hypothetical protein KA712_00725 [Myxococcales bacterium]|nr:hypothetical protein [Myxococcales bacterium]